MTAASPCLALPLPTAGFDPAERLACPGCGSVYDPARGDPRHEVPPGTAFARLPEVWRCPGCGRSAHGFFTVPAGMDPLAARLTALETAHRTVAATDMAGLVLCNRRLSVEAVGFRPHGAGWLGCLITPWTLNVVLFPDDTARWAGLRDGDKLVQDTPAGSFAFTAARLGALGVVMTIPAVSDMHVFSDQDEARAACAAALDALLVATAADGAAPADAVPEPTLPAPPPAPGSRPKTPMSRRSLFGGRGS